MSPATASQPEANLAAPDFRRLYRLTFCVGLLIGLDLLFWGLGYDGLRSPFGFNLSLIAALAGGARIVYGALLGLLNRDLGTDLALAIAMIAALVLGEYWVAAEVVLIAMIGESLEALTFSRTHRELRRIFELRPRTAHLKRGEQFTDAPVEALTVGDVVQVRPGERVPVDGDVTSGRSAVDQSTLTGESLPIDKSVGDAVYAGTLNQFGALEVQATKVGEDTTLGQIIRLVAKARKNKAAVERTADRLARVFLPLVLFLAACTFVGTNWSAITSSSARGLVTWQWMPTLAVLVVACPCSLILATPATVMAAMAWMARRGILTTGGAPLERLARVSRFAFDKTGTLTQGRPELAACVAFGEHSEDQILAWAAAAEQGSEHVIAQAIVRAANDGSLDVAASTDFQALPGAGVVAQVAVGKESHQAAEVLVGNRRLMQDRAVELSEEAVHTQDQLEAEGQTTLFICRDEAIVGVIGVRDTIRPEAAETISQLRALGIDDIALLTGDRREPAESIARAVGIRTIRAESTPAEKANWLADWCDPELDGSEPSDEPLCREQCGHEDILVAMVGDGVNDAPALAIADVGIALGGVGSDIAAEAGDVILMGDPLAPLPGLVRLSRQTLRVIRQNILLFAFGANLLGIALTAWIMPTWSEAWMARSPVAAAVFHQAGSILVLLNAMRLLWFDRWPRSPLTRLESWGDACSRGLLDRMAMPRRWMRWLWLNRGQMGRLAFLVLLLAYASQIFFFVKADEVAVIQRFGRVHSIVGPGAHCRLPPPWDRIVRERPNRVRTVEIGLRRGLPPGASSTTAIEWNTPHDPDLRSRQEDEALMLTGDQSLVELAATVQYRVKDVRSYRFAVREPDAMLKWLAEGALRRVIAERPLLADEDAGQAAEILTGGRGELEREMGVRLQTQCDALQMGIEILPQGVCLEDVHPPLSVVDAFRDVSSAFKERERMRNEAEAYRRNRLIFAAGKEAWEELAGSDVELDDALWMRLQERLAGEAVSELNSAKAFSNSQLEDAAGRAASYASLREARNEEPGLTEWRLYIETMAQAMSRKPKLILDGPERGRRHLLLGAPAQWPPASYPLTSEEPLDE